MRSDLMPTWDPRNATVWEKSIDLTFVAANSLILSVTAGVGVAANIFVLLAVVNQKSLQTWNNALVVNLAVTDIVRCVVDCPVLFAIVLLAHGGRHVDGLVCDAQVASFSFTCCIQLLTLACISAERYQAIAQPFQTSQRRRRIVVLISLTWIFASLVAVVCVLFLRDSPVHVTCRGAQGEASSYDTFGLYMLLPLWATCFGAIIVFYARIFMLVRSHSRKIFDKGTFPLSENSKGSQKKEETGEWNGRGKSEQNLSKSVEAETQPGQNPSAKCSAAALLASATAPQSYPVASENKSGVRIAVVITEMETEPPRVPHAEKKPVIEEESEAKPPNRGASVTHSTIKMQMVSGNFSLEKQSKERGRADKAPSETKATSGHVPSSPQLDNRESTSVSLSEPKQLESTDGGVTLAVAAADRVSALSQLPETVPQTEAAMQNMDVEGAVCMMPSKDNRERVNKKKESKMAKRAGYIIISFLLFWLPLITTILVNFVVPYNQNTRVSAASFTASVCPSSLCFQNRGIMLNVLKSFIIHNNNWEISVPEFLWTTTAADETYDEI